MDQETVPITKKDSFTRLEGISWWLLFALVFLLPVILLPITPVSFTKMSAVALVVVLVSAFWIIRKLKETTIKFPRHTLVYSGLILAAVTALSSILSASPRVSFWGYNLEVGTAVSVILGVLIILLTPAILRTRQRIFYFYVAFFASFFVVALYQTVRLFAGPDFFDFGLLKTTSSNLIGSWNELGIFFGLSALISLITIEGFSLSKAIRTLAIIVLAISLFWVALVNFRLIWIIVALFALVSSLYLFFFSKSGMRAAVDANAPVHKRPLGIASLVVLLIAVLFAIGPRDLDKRLARTFQIDNIEVFPSWAQTIGLTKLTYKTDPLFGVGPNLFSKQWIANKPADVNSTIFWNIDFNQGIGLIPTFFMTTGILGLLAWLAFFGSFLYAGYRAIFTPVRDHFTRFFILSSFFASLFLWVFAFIYVPSASIFMLTFLFTGAFLAGLFLENGVPVREWNYAKDARLSFVSVLVLIVLLVTAVVSFYYFGTKVVAAWSMSKAVAALNEKQDVVNAEKLISKAVRLDPRDEYYRTQSEINLLKLNQIVNQQGLDAEQLKAQVNDVWPKVVQSAEEAVRKDQANYQNWLQLGRVFEAVLPLQAPGAYDRAKQAYEEAAKRNPTNPAIELSLARLEARVKNTTAAREHIAKALQLKNNYIDAIFLLAQLDIDAGNIKSAIQSVGAAAFLSPNNPPTFFQLGLLKYYDKDYKGAIEALEHAVTLVPSYSNARYYLGLSQSRLGRTADAIANFEEIEKLNPESADVKSILTNLRAGRPALSASAETTKKTEPPVKDR